MFIRLQRGGGALTSAPFIKEKGVFLVLKMRKECVCKAVGIWSCRTVNLSEKLRSIYPRGYILRVCRGADERFYGVRGNLDVCVGLDCRTVLGAKGMEKSFY